MKTKYCIELTKPEVEHIASLIRMNEEEGTYYAPKNQYWNRSARIKKKLNDITKTCYMFQKPKILKVESNGIVYDVMAFEK